MQLYIQYIESENAGEVTVFLDDSLQIIGVVHDNDGCWRGEYFDPILKQVGLTVISTDIDEDQLNAMIDAYMGF